MTNIDFILLVNYKGCVNLHKAFEGLVYCSHPDNSNPCEGNCNSFLCPLIDEFTRCKEMLDECYPEWKYYG